MRRICSKCRKELAPIPIELNNSDIISYGMCVSCAERFSFEAPPDFLETLKVPAFTIDEDFIIHSVNKLACVLLQKPATEIKGKRHGEIFGCKYAGADGPCGTEPDFNGCNSCRIRNAVIGTFLTEKGTVHVPAYRKGNFHLHTENSQLEINTAKVGKLVLICIDFIESTEEIG